MTIINFEKLPEYLTIPGRIAGLDLGSKTIGCAVSDLDFTLASPRYTIKRRKLIHDAEELTKFLNHEKILAIIIGLPLNMDGSEGQRAHSTKAFVRNMEKITDLPFILQDERLSTIASERILIQQNISRKKRLHRVDCAAAAFILQSALDRLNFLKSNL